ncbi:MAG: dTMP kinase [candidate division KSB1 bacterium]|nr:dTMP kinase [candidate division KSB1 bacterium]MDZ7378185.1 dTMP kinase [candidate division KSB1 bacterium]MDZ7392204.1 dTMP kinase [candidate division KSB1 bacterium]MDZ7412639.1 dTMP kinase [candidate division KSB1 bacterium]
MAMAAKWREECEVAGRLITFEGIDGAGKSVQAAELRRWLESAKRRAAIIVRDPGTAPIAEQIRAILLDPANGAISPWTELLLYEAARAQLVEECIRPALARDMVVICDRFYDSTTAYQGYGRQLDLAKVTLANRLGACGVIPDLTIILDLDVEAALQRKGRAPLDRLEQEKRAFHERVRKGYLEIARAEPSRVKVVQGDRTVQAIAEEIRQLVDRVLGE